MSEELALGQREVVADGTHLFTEEEVALMSQNGTSPDEVLEFVRTSGVQTLNAAIGGIVEVKKGEGQGRNEPFSAPVETEPLTLEPGEVVVQEADGSVAVKAEGDVAETDEVLATPEDLEASKLSEEEKTSE